MSGLFLDTFLKDQRDGKIPLEFYLEMVMLLFLAVVAMIFVGFFLQFSSIVELVLVGYVVQGIADHAVCRLKSFFYYKLIA